MLEIKDRRLYFKGKPVFLIGVNYWPRRHPIWKMWKEFDEKELEEEAKQMTDIGINAVRLFLFGEDFSPGPYRINEESIEKARKLIRILHKHGIIAFPTLLVGHMSGENWEIPWREGKDLYKDYEGISRMLWFIKEIIERLKDEEGIGAWILSNELPLYIGGADFDTVENYLRYLYKVIKNIDPKRPYTTGDGHFAPLGYVPERVKDGLDYFGPHVYMYEDDLLRQTYWYSFAVRYCLSLGKPTILEEFGCSTVQVSEENQAALYNIVLHSCFMSGASGAFGWCYSDFPTEDIRPYVHHAHELMFGITRVDGSEKPVADVIRSFRKTIDKIDLSLYKVEEPHAVIVVPSYMYKRYPFMRIDLYEILRLLVQTYTLSRMASLNVSFIREEEPLENFMKYKLIIVPPLPSLLATTWRKLEEYVRKGGHLYMSYRYGVWCQNLRELFGIEHDMKYGIYEAPEVPSLLIKLEEKIGSLEKGHEVKLPVPGPSSKTAYCPILKASKVLALETMTGRIALTANELERGKAFFMTFPIETYGIMVYNFNLKTNAYELYKGIAGEAGIKPLVESTSPYVEVGALLGEEDLIVVAANHTYQEVESKVIVRRRASEVMDMRKDTKVAFEVKAEETIIKLRFRKGEGYILRVK
ncbi:MAG: hypothetical protein DRN15_05875 [Thermoprotei archaeon]|nr:MAG: hypothetical protein DRN15_05875 [Thermoprotei archaeon]